MSIYYKSSTFTKSKFFTFVILFFGTMIINFSCSQTESNKSNQNLLNNEAQKVGSVFGNQTIKESSFVTDMTIQTYKHGVITLSNSRNRPILINFWFPSCPACVSEIPALQRAFNAYGEQLDFLGVQQLGIDSPSEGQLFLSQFNITYPNTPDHENRLQSKFGILAYPTTIFVDNDYRVKKVWTGYIDDENLNNYIKSIIPN